MDDDDKKSEDEAAEPARDAAQDEGAKLRKVSEDELERILAAHKTWLETDGKEAEQADLSRTDLPGAYLFLANLQEASLLSASLQGADLFRANLRGANLIAANLHGANLARANFEGEADSNLAGADLSGANLQNADLSDAKLSNPANPRSNENMALNPALAVRRETRLGAESMST